MTVIANNWVSLIPPLITLLMAIFTKRIMLSLILGIISGSFILGKGLLTGVLKASDYLVASLASPESVYIIMFLFLFGALTEIFKVSGGIKGFASFAERFVKSERGALLSVWAATLATFFDCCFHVIATGTIAKPLINRVNGSKEKLAMIINVSSSQLVVMVPIATTYVGYIIGVTALAMQSAGITGSPYTFYLRGLLFNFYSIGMIIISFMVLFFGMGFGRWKLSKAKKPMEGVHGEHEAQEQCEFEEKISPRLTNLILPAALLLTSILALFYFTGRTDSTSFVDALMNADFSKSMFIAVFITLVITMVYYAVQKIPFSELESHFLAGGTEILPPIVILILAWTLSSITKDLGFISFVSSSLSAIPKLYIPAAVFLIGGITSYFIGSSWATWALIMPLGLPLAVGTGASLPLTMGAVLAGGSVGDNISPLGETPIISSTITEISIMDHIQTTLPYGIVVGILSLILFIIFQAVLG